MISRLAVNITIHLVILFSALTQASAQTAVGFMQKTIAKYNSASSVQSQVSKKVFLEYLGEAKESEGRLYYAKQSMRLELVGTEKSLIVMSKDNIWLETAGVTEGDKPQVTKIIAKDLSRQSRAPIALIFGQSKILSEFKVKSDKTESGIRKVSLAPKDPKKWKDLQNFYAEVNVKAGVIELAQYEDELANRTTFRFSDTKFNEKLDKKIFDYKPPAGAEVTIYK